MANHHPAAELLLAFSAGSLPLSQALCVSTHIESCDHCARQLQQLNKLGASLFETQAPAAAPDHIKQRVLTQLDDSPAAPATTASSRPSQIPHSLQQFINGDYDNLKWRYVTPSIRTAFLCMDNGAKVEMLRIKPGGKVATHTHTGDEYTLILEGSFSDDSGIYSKGDFILRTGRHKHKPVATKDRECICLTVTEAPIRLTGFFGRLLNPLIRKGFLPAG